MNESKNGSREVICQWLGVPRDPWPPDHYTLLGLPAGETNVDLIEQRVQERMEAVRCYQLTHPEPATEAMNRLAQAFSCLCDRRSKRTYDRDKLGLKSEPVLTPVAPSKSPSEGRTELLVEASPESAEVVQWNADAPAPSTENAPPAPPSPPAPPPIDPMVRVAQSSTTARRGLGTKKALYHRITRTRALLHAWEDAGKYLATAPRRPRTPAEARELIAAMRRIIRLLPEFPPLLGEAGQPGYLVVALARQTPFIPTFQTLLPSQREALARDWNNGQRLLAAHKQFLRAEVKAMRRRSFLVLGVRAAISFIDEHPVLLLVSIGVLALLIALWQSFV